MEASGFRRRDILRSTGLFATSLVAGRTVIFGADHAWAMTPTNLDPHTAQTLTLMAYELFPHDRVGMQYYAAVVESVDKEAGSDPALRKLLTDGVAKLDASHGMPWTEVSEGQRIAVLKSMETTDFFGTMRTRTINALYGNPRVYRMFGYEGSSVEYGGYLERGFDDIGWLPST
jgi:hypothetical protein